MSKKIPTRKTLTLWLAKALCYVPPTLCQTEPFMIPPQWVRDAKAECNRVGIKFKPPEPKKAKVQRERAS